MKMNFKKTALIIILILGGFFAKAQNVETFLNK